MAKQRVCRICKGIYKDTYLTKTVIPQVCSCKCAVIYYEGTKPKGRKLAKDIARMVGRRSMAEVKFDAANLEDTSIDAQYEVDTFTYRVEETCKYTPDWTIKEKNGRIVYLEYKGVLDGKTRKKMKLVKKFNPKLDIRLIFEKASNKIYKGSLTTYGQWATKHGFKWTDNELPRDCHE